MIRPSVRFTLPLVLLLALAAIPVWLHELRPRRIDSCADSHSLRRVEAIPRSREESQHVAELSPSRIQWSEGTILDDSGEPTPLRFHVVRDFDAHRFYVRPYSMAEDLEPERSQQREMESEAGPISIRHVMDPTTQVGRGATSVASYTFLYGNEPTDSLLAAKLRRAPWELFGSSRPVTMFLVTGAVSERRSETLVDRGDQWLRDAVDYYVEACRRV